jgi:aryl-alcohol dehydrogenase-like predicted oxidoreductase
MHYGISNVTGRTEFPEISRILQTAKQNHIHLIDTASAYGNAEDVLGSNDLRDFRVVSKFLPVSENGRIFNQCMESIRRLGVPELYGYLSHRPNRLTEEPESWRELAGLKELKLVKKIGFSLYHPEELDALLDKGYFPDIIQVPYNYFDRRFEDHMIAICKKGCEIHVRSVFLQGLFFLDTDSLNSYFTEVKPIIKKLQLTIENLPAALLNFVLNKPFVDKVIIGIETNDQLIMNLQGISMNEELPELDVQISELICNPSKWPNKL